MSTQGARPPRQPCAGHRRLACRSRPQARFTATTPHARTPNLTSSGPRTEDGAETSSVPCLASSASYVHAQIQATLRAARSLADSAANFTSPAVCPIEAVASWWATAFPTISSRASAAFKARRTAYVIAIPAPALLQERNSARLPLITFLLLFATTWVRASFLSKRCHRPDSGAGRSHAAGRRAATLTIESRHARA